jgi:hypothetical protein
MMALRTRVGPAASVVDVDDLSPRLRAVCDLDVAEMREYSGRHEYDGEIQDLSPAGVQVGLARLAKAAELGEREDDPHDEAHLRTSENTLRVMLGDLELHRRNPVLHLANLDIACYDRPYAPAEERARGRLAHLAAWPEAIESAINALDQVSAPIAAALADGIRGLATNISPDVSESIRDKALAAHARLVAHIDRAIESGATDPSLGAPALAALMSSSECMAVDLGKLAERADAERDRLTALLAESCARVDPGLPPYEVARALVREHPPRGRIVAAAQHWAEASIRFTRERDLVPYHDGQCLVQLAPKSRRWATAMLCPAAPGEPDGPCWYYITPPEESWPENEAEEWLRLFSSTTLPGITVHEVAPGHFSHSRAMRRAPTPVRRVLHSDAFTEGWAHYAEELCLEEGFCNDDPRFAIGVVLEALVRVTRLSCAIGVHAAGMSVAEAARMFEARTYLSGPAAVSEAYRATFDPTYGRYTWGKLEILGLRERAKREWGADFRLGRFHAAMLKLGSPPLGLLSTAVDRRTDPAEAIWTA